MFTKRDDPGSSLETGWSKAELPSKWVPWIPDYKTLKTTFTLLRVSPLCMCVCLCDMNVWICMCMHQCRYTCTYACMCGHQRSILEMFHNFSSTHFSRQSLLTEPGAHYYSKASWVLSFRNLPTPALTAWGCKFALLHTEDFRLASQTVNGLSHLPSPTV